ncbi:MAG: hypothetical protein DMG19_13625 [Acidobacteria bacterium]|nr:MAG: hypothetical protein DMG19_13625 [Acidobacteriota bacterium]
MLRIELQMAINWPKPKLGDVRNTGLQSVLGRLDLSMFIQGGPDWALHSSVLEFVNPDDCH